MKRLFSGLALALIAAGCTLEQGGNVSLTGGEWTIETLAGVQSLTVSPTLQFDGAGRFSGFAGCNRMMGSYRHAGDALGFGPVGATKMLCADAQMQVERAVFAALGQVTRVEAVGPTLRLLAGDAVLITARR